jgi:hypothetical protein
MERLDRLFEAFEAGAYTKLEIYAAVAQMTTQENIGQIIEEMPERYREGFARWIQAYPFKHEATGYIGTPLEYFTDDLIGHYKRHYATLEHTRGG